MRFPEHERPHRAGRERQARGRRVRLVRVGGGGDGGRPLAGGLPLGQEREQVALAREDDPAIALRVVGDQPGRRRAELHRVSLRWGCRRAGRAARTRRPSRARGCARSDSPAGGGVGDLGGVDEHADRVLVEDLAGAHVLAGLGPVTEVVDLQLDEVAVGVLVVVGERHPVVEAEVGLDPGLAQPQVAGVEVLEGVVLERAVVQPGAGVLLGVVDEPGEREQRDAVVGRIVGQPRADVVLEQHLGADDERVPVDQLLQPASSSG